MNLEDLLSDPVRELETELTHIDEFLRQAASRNDTGTLEKLARRKVELPKLIHEAKLRDVADKINAQRQRLGSYEMDFRKANEEAGTLARELTPKLTALNQEIEALRVEALEAQAVRESLRFAVNHATTELEKLKKERQDLLLSPLSLTE